MRKSVLFILLFSAIISINAQNLETIKLNAPDKQRGESVMQAFSKRQSTRTFSDKKLTLQDLSDLLWAANGINRPESGKRTAPSAMNKQDVEVYVCTEEGSYQYNPKSHSLDPVSKGDVRPLKAPVCLVLVTDTDDTWAALDAGIVSQNISVFCAGTGLATVPRGSMDKDELKKALKLKDSQHLMLNHPVGYPQ
ncbi:MAG: SagB/ThcOx family dehydrogenase [Bacteroidales bacterium]|nr:SagB/ThcOx family dehydrogenase [Bacteroidales bacterium]